MLAQFTLSEFGKDLLKQTVVGFVAIAMTLIFLGFMKLLINQMLFMFHDKFDEMHKEHIYAREQTKLSVDRNTAALESNSSATNRTSMEISALTKAIDNLARNNGHHK